MKSISMKLPDALDARLTKLAGQRGAPKSAVVREALEAYFSSPNGSGPVSCLDLAGKLVGCVEGPKDLATNKKYLRGYGR